MTGGPVGLLWTLLAALASAALETVTNNSSAVYWPGMYYHLYGTDMPCTADGCYFPVNATEDPPLAGRRRRPTSSPLLEDERDPADPCFVTGHLDLSKNWYGYLAVMNMQSVGGKLFYRFVYPENACCVKILLYLQEQMDKLRANMNCLQKQAVLDAMSPQVITLSPSIPSSGCSVNRSVIGGVRMIECSSGRMLQSARARRWYVAAVSCGSPTGLNLRYSMLIYGHVGRCPKDYSAPAVAVVARPSSWALIVNVLVIHMSLCHALL